ncbi:hypothetical protein JX266_005562 [Neoarthrinium moseri]|nr:hypothetical protein JX266_005562 [Neoarthrinium moseri]
MFKHGVRHGAILGWGYLFIFLTLRIVSSAMQMNDPRNPSAALVASIGLSPLLLSAVSILHEARAYCVVNRRSRIDLGSLVVLHFIISTAVALTGAGASGAQKHGVTEEERAKDLKLVEAGMGLLLLSLVALLGSAVFSLSSSSFRSRHELPYQRQGKWLTYAVLYSLPFIAIRIISSLVYFSTQSAALNPVSGDIGYRVGFGLVDELIVSIILIIAGLCTLNAGRDQSGSRGGSESTALRK